jgi:CRISPR-associated endonuclease/helicase Cas3
VRLGKSVGVNLQRSGIRHEMDSLRRMSEAKVALPRCGYVAVAAHHRKLSRYHEKRWMGDDRGKFEPFWKHFCHLSAELRHDKREHFDDAIARRYEYSGLRAMLQLADGRASAGEDMAQGESLPTLRPFSYKFPHKTRRGVQEVVAQVWDEPFAMLRAPTGAGKTDAALLWAQHQIEAGRADRLVIAMPTRFTANALAISTAASLSATGLYHSSAWYQAKKKNPDSDWQLKRQLDAETSLARELQSPITVTTLDHLCICLTGAREDHHAIFWGLAHSCVVVDEADFYDPFTQRNMVVLLRALRLLQVPVLVMSATVPESARELYALSGLRAEQIHEDSSDSDRVRCRLYRAGQSVSPEDIEPLLERALNGEPTIIYANTVKRAQKYLSWLLSHGMDAEDVVLYHSRFTEPDKARIEERLSEMLGPQAWKDGLARGVAVLTQIGELSVNISADLMISDLCPLDRLAQRAGRLSRFGDRADGRGKVVGELHLVEPARPAKDGTPQPYPAPYGKYLQGQGWEESRVLRESNAWLQAGQYSARRWVEGVNDLYPEVEPEDARTRKNRRVLEESAVANWLLGPVAQVEEDEGGTHAWKSRDVPPQHTVYAGVQSPSVIAEDVQGLYFSTRQKFREWALEHGIQVYAYEAKKALQNEAIEKRTVSVGEDTEEIFLVPERLYSELYGLRLGGDEDESAETSGGHDDD